MYRKITIFSEIAARKLDIILNIAICLFMLFGYLGHLVASEHTWFKRYLKLDLNTFNKK